MRNAAPTYAAPESASARAPHTSACTKPDALSTTPSTPASSHAMIIIITTGCPIAAITVSL